MYWMRSFPADVAGGVGAESFCDAEMVGPKFCSSVVPGQIELSPLASLSPPVQAQRSIVFSKSLSD